ncbi:MAG: hypothetical protein ACK4VY_05420 [Brevundimonas sp.]
MRALAFATLLLVSAPLPAMAQTAAEAAAEPAIAMEARAFMAGYASDLLAGDRAGIADRYDRQGAWMVHAGQARFFPHDQIARLYADGWGPPSAFEWRDLTFIPSGDDAVTVVGRFVWTSEGEPPAVIAYHGQFVRQDGQLRIRVEDETPVAPDAP